MTHDRFVVGEFMFLFLVRIITLPRGFNYPDEESALVRCIDDTLPVTREPFSGASSEKERLPRALKKKEKENNRASYRCRYIEIFVPKTNFKFDTRNM